MIQSASISFDSLPADGLIRLETVLLLTGLKRSTLYHLIQQGAFPKQIRIGPRATAWRVGDLRLWLKDPEVYATAEASGTA